MAKKTWKEKLQGARPASVEVLDKPMMGMPAGTRLFIATPTMVKEYVDAIPIGKSKTVAEMRESFAKSNKADATCPLTSGIFLRIVAEAALDEEREGKRPSQVSPFWRIVEPKSPLAKKLSCGPGLVEHRRALEKIS